jgi:hypothetical protein
MVALGVGTFWAGFTMAIWGYCLVKGYDVPFSGLFRQTWPGTQVSQQAPTAGHKLGTITGHAVVTNPAQIQAGLGQ